MKEETLESKVRGQLVTDILTLKFILATANQDTQWIQNVLSEMVSGITQYTRLAGHELQGHITQTLQSYYEYDKWRSIERYS